MNAKEMRGMDLESLKTKLSELREERFWLGFKNRGGLLDKPGNIKVTRREVARAMTILHEKQSAAEGKKNG